VRYRSPLQLALPGHDRSWEESCAVGAPPLSRLLGTRTGRVPPLGVVTTRERPPLGWLPRGMDTAGRSRVPSGTHAERGGVASWETVAAWTSQGCERLFLAGDQAWIHYYINNL
jgi:hypothetical protein